ncbi:MAG: hypothetical protein LBN27_12250 [Prevotellaceae bacterium]|jgi:hypothetical protein|nr:hypothetical protein [Prevotellaceae bacterium]
MEIKLNIRNEYLFHYLEYLFEKRDDRFVVSQTSDFGRLLCSHFKRSAFPVPYQAGQYCANFILPKSLNIASNAERYYIYFDSFDTQRLNNALLAESNIDFKQYYLTGKAQGFMQKDIINAYIISRNLVDIKNDRIKKRVFREEEKNLEKIRNILQNKAKYLTKNISNSIKKEINDCITEY